MKYINEKNRIKTERFISDFIYKIENRESMKKYTRPEIVFYISEILGTDLETEKLIALCNTLIKELVSDIQEGKQYVGGMFSDFGILVFAINNIHRKTGELKKLNTSLNSILLDYAIRLADTTRNKKISMRDYDCISGVSGLLYYLLDTDLSALDEDEIQNLIKYLIWLTKNHSYKDYEVINFHIENEMQFRQDERDTFKDGIINFGLAHGMTGVLATLLKVYENDLYNDKNELVKAMETIFKIYEKFEININGIYHYPTQLDFNKYINGICDKNINNAGWCYGNISNVLILYKMSKILNWEDKVEKYEIGLKKIINQPTEMYNLEHSVLCHGYASVITEQICLYQETKDLDFLHSLDNNIELMMNAYENYNEYYDKNEDIRIKQNGISAKIQGHKDDLSFLCGSGGIFLTLLNKSSLNINYGKLLMIR